jgi:hypothetical protein
MRKGNLTWFEMDGIKNLSVLTPELTQSESSDSTSVSTSYFSDLAPPVFRENRLIIDHKSRDYDGKYTMQLTLTNDKVIGGDYLNDGKGDKDLVANIDGCLFSSDNELLVLGTYTNLDKSDGALGFILRVQK